MVLAANLLQALCAVALEAAFSYPDWLYRRIGHPVTWIGAFIAATESRFNRESWSDARRRAAGLVSLVVWLAITGGIAALITLTASSIDYGWLGGALLASSLPAQRSLDRHVTRVAEALEQSGLEAGRRAVGMIVGRNTAVLDEAGVARAAIESLAENFSDGVVAPVFWLALGGLPGGVLYKTINTADSMVGHRTKRFESFGWASARLDDLVNLPASRLTALLLVLAARLDGRSALQAGLTAIRRDAGKHRSPNAGWPEAAMAGALGLKLAGPRVYGSELVEDCYMGNGRRAADAADIRRALRLYRRACIGQFCLLALAALLFTALG